MGGRRISVIAVIAVTVVLFLALNVLSQTLFRGARLDLTENSLYTLSDGTRQVLGELTEPLTVRFYYSAGLAADLPSIRQYAQRVQELLETYAAETNGEITLQVIDPAPFSDAEDEAVAFGLQGAPVNEAGDRLYFGMAATNTTDDTEIISFFQETRETLVEYDLTRAFYKLGNPKQGVVGIISTLPINGGYDPQRGPSEPWYVAAQIAQLFEVRDLGLEIAVVPEDVDVLMVVHPKELKGMTRFAIDQFVLGGGKAMVFVDPFSELAASIPDPNNPARLHNSRLPELFKAWGVELAPGFFVGDRLAARKVRAGNADDAQAIDYLAWLVLHQENMNSDEVVTSQLGAINVATMGALSATEGATTEFIPLLTSSNQSQLIERMVVQFMPNPQQMLANFEASGETYVMAARVSGPVKTAFPDGRPLEDGELPPPAEGEEGYVPQLMESASPAQLVLVADSDLLGDRMWVQMQQFIGQAVAIPLADNGPFVVNAIDVLAGSDALIGLRSRGTSERPFEVVQALQRAAEDRFRETEEILKARVSEVEARLAEIQTSQGGSALVLSDEQQDAMTAFRAELVDVRKQLRDVQLALRQDIESMGVTLKFLNIALVPLLIGFVAVIVSFARRQRRRRAVAGS
jgi:ABC-type uncharacterized transport system involved in gliding motility auxiliary subunit